MAIQVETGQGLEDANSYASVETFKDYCKDRGIDLTGKSDDDLASALIASTDWIDANYSNNLQGYPAFGQQALQFPRQGVCNPQTGTQYPIGYMPPRIVKATCALATRALKGELWNTQSGTGPQLIEKTTGPLTKKYNPLKPSELTMQPNFDEVRQIMGPLMRGLNQLRVSR